MGAWMLRPGHRVESDQMSKSKQNQPRAGKDNAAGKAASAKADTPRAASASRREQLRVQQEAEARRRRVPVRGGPMGRGRLSARCSGRISIELTATVHSVGP